MRLRTGVVGIVDENSGRRLGSKSRDSEIVSEQR